MFNTILLPITFYSFWYDILGHGWLIGCETGSIVNYDVTSPSRWICKSSRRIECEQTERLKERSERKCKSYGIINASQFDQKLGNSWMMTPI